MRSAGNFSPEWGYLAPAPSFARTARVILVATAIGATAGAGVVLSLVDRSSEPEKTPVAAHVIVTSVRAAAVPSVAPAAPATVTAPAKLASPPASVAAAPPSDKPGTSARASSRTTPPTQPATPPAANIAAPTPAASTAAVLPNTAAPAAAQTTSALPIAAVNSGTAVPAAAPASASASAAGEPSNVVEAAPADAPDSTAIMAPEQATPPKKAKHHASSNKNAQFQGIGSAVGPRPKSPSLKAHDRSGAARAAAIIPLLHRARAKKTCTQRICRRPLGGGQRHRKIGEEKSKLN